MSIKNDHPFTPGSLVVGYFRDSGHEDQELSVPQQKAEAQKFCAQNSLTMTRIFVDEARPGSTVVGRKQFQEMIHYLRSTPKPQEKGVLIWKFSRFARDQDDSQFYKADLRRRGYFVYSLMDHIPDGPEGRFFEAALDWMNQKYLLDLSDDVKRGLRHLVEHYHCVPGPAPRGIKRIPVVIGKRRDGRDHVAHRWEPDPAWIPRIQQAFAMKAEGLSLTTIRETTGLFKSLNSYNTFFKNKIWLGILEYGTDLVIEDYCTPVITQATYEAVQQQLALHAEHQNIHSDRLHPRRKNSRFLLSGLVYCPRCGGAMSGFTSRDRRGNTSERYGCGRAKRTGECDMPLIPKYGLEQAILDELVDHLLQPNTLRELQAEMREQAAGKADQLLEGERDLRAQLKGVEQALDNVTLALEQAGTSTRLITRLQELEQTHAQLTGKLTVLEGQLQEVDAVPEFSYSQAELAKNMRQSLREGSEEARRAIVQGLVEKVIVDRFGRNLAGKIWFYVPQNQKSPSGEGDSEYTARRSRRGSS